VAEARRTPPRTRKGSNDIDLDFAPVRLKKAIFFSSFYSRLPSCQIKYIVSVGLINIDPLSDPRSWRLHEAPRHNHYRRHLHQQPALVFQANQDAPSHLERE
jgi:hypothetical protein